MRYRIDHDYHIHSYLSTCSGDPEQNADRILAYALENGFGSVCVTDHYWDKAVPCMMDFCYGPQDFDNVKRILPLPKSDSVHFAFGCETDMDLYHNVGIPKERYDDFELILIPTTHMQVVGYTVTKLDAATCEGRAKTWIERLDAVLNKDLPYKKVGLAHLACYYTNPNSREEYVRTLDLIPDEEMHRLFSRVAELGCGVELNQSDMCFKDHEADSVLRMFRIAKHHGCKFYIGSDSHHPSTFKSTIPVFERALRLLDLSESDKFHI